MVIADKLARKQREISVAEFFKKNRHLLGFDSKRKALLTGVKEAVDNSLDASEEMGVLPDIFVRIKDVGDSGTRYRIIVEDNGPGIVEEEVPNIFAKLLYGSRFHTLKMARGQQGIGISAAALYSQMSTGKPIKIITRTAKDRPAHLFKLRLNIEENEPEVVEKEKVNFNREHGTRIEMDMEGYFISKGRKSIREYLRRTSVVNPHAKVTFINPGGKKYVFKRVTEELPREPEEIKPHPYGIELGTLKRMLKNTKRRTLKSFLQNEFSSVGAKTAKEICSRADIDPKISPKSLERLEAQSLIKAIEDTKIYAPPLDCLSPIGAVLIKKNLKEEENPDFVYAVSRDPKVYRGMPFQVEAAICYGGKLEEKSDEKVKIMRYANKVPLLYRRSRGAIAKTIKDINWKRYELDQPGGRGTPKGPAAILVHIGSVWVPFESESKNAVANYPKIRKEIKLALQECGRKLKTYLNKRQKRKRRRKKMNKLKSYSDEIADSLAALTEGDEKEIKKKLHSLIKEKVIENGK